jgi:integrase
MGDVKAFFEFCLSNRWIPYNPARFKQIKNRATLQTTQSKQHLAFSDEELGWMYAACEKYGKESVRVWPKKKNGKQVQAIDEYCNYNRRYSGEDIMEFIALSAWTGLRISDIVLFNIERLEANGLCKIRAMKNNKWVYTKLPDWLANRMRARARKYGPLVFGPYQSTRIETLTNKWRTHLMEVWEQCGPWKVKPNPHRFRHTFIRILLQNGVAVEKVGDLVGDTPETIRKYYSDWADGRQDALTAALESAFASVPNPFDPKPAKVVNIMRG